MSSPKFDDYQPEIEAIKADGYLILDQVVCDFGQSLGLIVTKHDEALRIMLRECFYDTDAAGQITCFHGVTDIRETHWSKGVRRAQS